MHDSLHESLCKSFCKFLCESSTDYRDKGLHYLQTRLYLPTDWLLLHTQSGLLSSYYIERVEIEQRSRAAAPDAAPDQAAEFTPQRNRSTKQNPTKVSPRGDPKGESIGGSIWGSIWGYMYRGIRMEIQRGNGGWESCSHWRDPVLLQGYPCMLPVLPCTGLQFMTRT